MPKAGREIPFFQAFQAIKGFSNLDFVALVSGELLERLRLRDTIVVEDVSEFIGFAQRFGDRESLADVLFDFRFGVGLGKLVALVVFIAVRTFLIVLLIDGVVQVSAVTEELVSVSQII